MPARVFACVLADDSGKLTAQELASRLQVSPAAVSGAVRYLPQARLLLGEDRPAGRRLRETQEFFAFLRQELPLMMDRWHASRARG